MTTDTHLLSTKNELTHTKLKLHHAISEYETLRQSFLQAQRQAFGKKSERFVDDTPQQATLFSPETPATDIDENDLEPITYTRCKKKSK